MWDPFADPADVESIEPISIAPSPAPRGRRETTALEIPSVAELESTSCTSCPELVQATFEGDEKRVEDSKKALK